MKPRARGATRGGERLCTSPHCRSPRVARRQCCPGTRERRSCQRLQHGVCRDAKGYFRANMLGTQAGTESHGARAGLRLAANLPSSPWRTRRCPCRPSPPARSPAAAANLGPRRAARGACRAPWGAQAGRAPPTGRAQPRRPQQTSQAAYGAPRCPLAVPLRPRPRPSPTARLFAPGGFAQVLFMVARGRDVRWSLAVVGLGAQQRHVLLAHSNQGVGVPCEGGRMGRRGA